ncbi:unnamed protein product [Gadus morhua 'NCC']
MYCYRPDEGQFDCSYRAGVNILVSGGCGSSVHSVFWRWPGTRRLLVTRCAQIGPRERRREFMKKLETVGELQAPTLLELVTCISWTGRRFS